MTEANGLPPGTTAQQPAAGTENGEGGAWWTGLATQENRQFAENKNWKTNDDALTSHRELEALVSKSIRPLGDNPTPDEEAAFYAKLGRPEKPEGYELKLDTKTVPETFPYDENSAREFRNWAHEAGLSPKQAQKLHDKFVSHQAQLFGQATEQQAKATREAEEKRTATEEQAHRDIVRAWGEPGSETYKAKVSQASQAINELGLKDMAAERGILSSDGAVLEPKFVFAMQRFAEEVLAEGSTPPPGTTPSAKQADMATNWYGATTPQGKG